LTGQRLSRLYRTPIEIHRGPDGWYQSRVRPATTTS